MATCAALAGLCVFPTLAFAPPAASAAAVAEAASSVTPLPATNDHVTDADAELGHVVNTPLAHVDDGAIVSPRARARIAVKRTLPPTGVRTEDAMEAGGVFLAVGTTLLLIRRKRRQQS